MNFLVKFNTRLGRNFVIKSVTIKLLALLSDTLSRVFFFYIFFLLYQTKRPWRCWVNLRRWN